MLGPARFPGSEPRVGIVGDTGCGWGMHTERGTPATPTQGPHVFVTVPTVLLPWLPAHLRPWCCLSVSRPRCVPETLPWAVARGSRPGLSGFVAHSQRSGPCGDPLRPSAHQCAPSKVQGGNSKAVPGRCPAASHSRIRVVTVEASGGLSAHCPFRSHSVNGS